MQAASLLIVNRSSSQREEQAAVASIVANNIVSVNRYKGSSYLAVVALATEDWKLLLEQRQAAIDLARNFERSMKVLLDGGEVTIGGTVFRVAALSDQAERAAATAAVEHVADGHRAPGQDAALTRPPYRRQRRDRPRFARPRWQRSRSSSRFASSPPAAAGASRRGSPWSREVFRIAATLLVIVLAVVVHRRMVRPLDRAIWDLDRAKAALEGTVRKLASAQAELVEASHGRHGGDRHQRAAQRGQRAQQRQRVARLVATRLQDHGSRADRASRCCESIAGDLGEFLARDERGRSCPATSSVRRRSWRRTAAIARRVGAVCERTSTTSRTSWRCSSRTPAAVHGRRSVLTGGSRSRNQCRAHCRVTRHEIKSSAPSEVETRSIQS